MTIMLIVWHTLMTFMVATVPFLALLLLRVPANIALLYAALCAIILCAFQFLLLRTPLDWRSWKFPTVVTVGSLLMAASVLFGANAFTPTDLSGDAGMGAAIVMILVFVLIGLLVGIVWLSYLLAVVSRRMIPTRWK